MYIFEAKALFTFVFSFFVTLYLVPIFSKIAFKWGILDSPDGKLKKHKAAIPYLGGVAVWLSFLITCSLVLPFENQFFLYIFASTILLFIGLVDDLIALTPSQKIFGQFLAILCYLKAGFYLKINFFSNVWNIFISAFWFLSIINAFNLIDVMDGLASTVAISVAVFFLIFAFCLKQTSLILLLLAFIGSLSAFLCFNKPSAKMYLGDAGSLFIGGFIASIPFCLSWSEYNFYGYFIPLILCAVPLIEMFTLICVRTLKRQPFFCGSPDHFSIFLQEKGWSKYLILIFSFLTTFLLGVLSFLFFYNYLSLSFILSLGILVIFIWFFLLL
ncbi:TPA: hypothetical protein DIC20_03575 [Candidatus Dependentiae bacterium]|nr:MAG: hypothetical protein US03_C0001G0102 [candidate division TM6 bacterium GW2011_GWF2_36_131]KKQ03762.1 MAG: hypothetical protein US13_C0001G0102 [candidate division TM6 bacterium GW2011_GWE2_36_25]KKQ19907.1 MAG: hypothetical protein US32_C0003G0024 [candidate division TM6 bacterium GW2011_GWA2_36_9]HBR70528.1 hypothetical protein [Candidatus Dependentiae bacterium]HCU00756.1 hypothetical protein [Candidatus Dependentiae bacterium]